MLCLCVRECVLHSCLRARACVLRARQACLWVLRVCVLAFQCTAAYLVEITPQNQVIAQSEMSRIRRGRIGTLRAVNPTSHLGGLSETPLI